METTVAPKKSKLGWFLLGFIILIAIIMVVIYIKNKKFLSVGDVALPSGDASRPKPTSTENINMQPELMVKPSLTETTVLPMEVTSLPKNAMPLPPPNAMPNNIVPVKPASVPSTPLKTTSNVPGFIKTLAGQGKG